MGIRETLNKNPALTTGVTGGIIGIALIYILYSVIFSGGGGSGGTFTQAYYSIDDGKTFYADEIDLVPPLQKDGKEAVRVFVFTCDGGKTKFVAYMERFTPKGKKALEDARAKAKANPNQDMSAEFMAMEQIQFTEREVKKPGEGKWVKASSNESGAVMSIKCPEGQSDENLEPVLP